MNNSKTDRLASIAAVCGLCCLFTACASLQGKMDHYDAKMQSKMRGRKWNEAKRIIETADFGEYSVEQTAIENWRLREDRLLKHGFAKHLQPKVDAARALYMRGAFNEGEKCRDWLNDEQTDIPAALLPCIELARDQMSSDRALAEMTMAYRDYRDEVEQIDVNGGKEAVKRLEAIDKKRKLVEEKAAKVARFKEALSIAVSERWAPMDAVQYEVNARPMEKARGEFTALYSTRWWNASVPDRKNDYRRVEELIASGKCEEAKRLFMSLAWLIPPEGMQDGTQFDDLAERARIAGQGIGDMVVKDIVESGLPGVHYPHRDAKHRVISALVVGRALVGRGANQGQRREAGRAARLQASAEFARFLSTSVQSKSQMSVSEVDGEVHGDFSTATRESAEAKVSNLFVVATGLYRTKTGDDEVVYILGWRDPAYGGTIVPEKMIRIDGNANLTISPSVGAYL